MNHLLFPTLIVEHTNPKHKEIKEIFFNNIMKYIDPETGFSGESTGHVNIHHETHFLDLYSFVSKCVEDYLIQLSIDVSRFDINIVKSWLNVIEKRSTPIHNHNDAHYSFVYYVNIPENANQSIRFYNNEVHMSEPYDYMFVNNATEWNLLNSGSWSFVPEEGKCFVFPAKLRHDTHSLDGSPMEPIETNYDTVEKLYPKRIAIAGDILLTHKSITTSPTGIQPISNWKTFI